MTVSQQSQFPDKRTRRKGPTVFERVSRFNLLLQELVFLGESLGVRNHLRSNTVSGERRGESKGQTRSISSCDNLDLSFSIVTLSVFPVPLSDAETFIILPPQLVSLSPDLKPSKRKRGKKGIEGARRTRWRRPRRQPRFAVHHEEQKEFPSGRIYLHVTKSSAARSRYRSCKTRPVRGRKREGATNREDCYHES